MSLGADWPVSPLVAPQVATGSPGVARVDAGEMRVARIRPAAASQRVVRAIPICVT
jgi:hypothetical protein